MKNNSYFLVYNFKLKTGLTIVLTDHLSCGKKNDKVQFINNVLNSAPNIECRNRNCYDLGKGQTIEMMVIGMFLLSQPFF
jgi:hypothetical protein